MSIKIIGLGNRLYGDDAVGSLTAACMEELGLPAFDANSNGFQALSAIENGDIVFFIDIVQMDEEEGIFKVDLDKADFVEITDPHRLTPLQVLSLSARSNNRPKEAYIVGIKPEYIDWPGISDAAIKRLEKVLQKFKKFISTYGIDVDIDKVIQCVKSKSKEPW
ncbi:hydrogenase maturation protease [Stygiolobus sp. CP8521M]|uniref:hydrogenase maturation protease n=1 Tax=Stygiolobus sp. CP8521M TaxID=3133136 RepID=UPI00307D80C1